VAYRRCAAYIDFAKAFDSISGPKLCHKLAAYGISGNLLAWINNFVSNRQQCTRVGNAYSSSKTLTSGVVQGSCLGPLLFILYVNDICKIFNERCTGKLYADDVKCYTTVELNCDHSHSQKCLDDLTVWSKAWQLKISFKKCFTLYLGRQRLLRK
jgi:ribonuclease P/MRP protein subunit RPP40